jgi:hypothetical protein
MANVCEKIFLLKITLFFCELIEFVNFRLKYHLIQNQYEKKSTFRSYAARC